MAGLLQGRDQQQTGMLQDALENGEYQYISGENAVGDGEGDDAAHKAKYIEQLL